MAITNKNLRIIAERESERLLEEHVETGLSKSLLKLSNGFDVIFEILNCPVGCKPGFETIIINGEKVIMRVCKRPNGSICG